MDTTAAGSFNNSGTAASCGISGEDLMTFERKKNHMFTNIILLYSYQ